MKPMLLGGVGGCCCRWVHRIVTWKLCSLAFDLPNTDASSFLICTPFLSGGIHGYHAALFVELVEPPLQPHLLMHPQMASPTGGHWHLGFVRNAGCCEAHGDRSIIEGDFTMARKASTMPWGSHSLAAWEKGFTGRCVQKERKDLFAETYDAGEHISCILFVIVGTDDKRSCETHD